MKKLLLLAIVALGITTISYGQTEITDEVTASTTATIITPISITHTDGDDLMFGGIIADTDGGTVTVSTDDGIDYVGVTTQAAITGTVQAATFTVEGPEGTTFAITLPDPFDLTGPVGADPMEVSAFTSNPETEGTIGAGGSTTIKVGATLTVNGNQAAGSYSNDAGLVITVAYN